MGTRSERAAVGDELQQRPHVDAHVGDGQRRYGAASSYLTRFAAGDAARVRAYVEPNPRFRLPEDPARDIIMIGPGTGVAPFRGFLQERAALKAAGKTLGPAILFFGCRHPDQDFIYREELEAFAAQGVCELRTAFSRHEGKRVYVQDLVKAEARKLWAMLEAAAHVYVCGDGSRMEPDVKRALVDMYCDEKEVSAEEGEAWIERMGAENRYNLDVWAGS